MRKHKLDQACAKRLQASDFGQQKYQPLLTRNETIAFFVAFIMVIAIVGFLTFTTYFQGLCQ